MDKDTLTTQEVAERLGVTATRVRAMIAAGRLPAQKFGPVYVTRLGDLKHVADRQTGRPSKQAGSTRKAATGRASANGGTPTKRAGKKRGKR